MNLHGYDIINNFKNPINHVINLHKDLINSQNLYFLKNFLQMHVLIKNKVYFL